MAKSPTEEFESTDGLIVGQNSARSCSGFKETKHNWHSIHVTLATVIARARSETPRAKNQPRPTPS